MNNVNELRIETKAVYEALKRKELTTKEGDSMVNCVGKMIGSVKLELEYYKLRKEEPNIPFLKYKK